MTHIDKYLCSEANMLRSGLATPPDSPRSDCLGELLKESAEMRRQLADVQQGVQLILGHLQIAPGSSGLALRRLRLPTLARQEATDTGMVDLTDLERADEAATSGDQPLALPVERDVGQAPAPSRGPQKRFSWSAKENTEQVEALQERSRRRVVPDSSDLILNHSQSRGRSLPTKWMHKQVQPLEGEFSEVGDDDLQQGSAADLEDAMGKRTPAVPKLALGAFQAEHMPNAVGSAESSEEPLGATPSNPDKGMSAAGVASRCSSLSEPGSDQHDSEDCNMGGKDGKDERSGIRFGKDTSARRFRRRGRKADSARFASDPLIRLTGTTTADGSGSPRRHSFDVQRRPSKISWHSIVSSLEPPCEGRSGTKTRCAGSIEALRTKNDMNLIGRVATDPSMEVLDLDLDEDSSLGYPEPILEVDDADAPQHDMHPALVWCSEKTMLFAPLVPRFCGLLPWTARCPWISWIYQMCAMGFAILVLAGSCWRVEDLLHCHQGDESSQAHQNEVTMAIFDSLSALIPALTLVVCWAKDAKKGMLDLQEKIMMYACGHGEAPRWGTASLFDLTVSGLLCLGTIASRVMISDVRTSRSAWLFEMGIFVATTLLNTALASHILHLCRGLAISVDAFCGIVVRKADFRASVRHWSCLQAILRRTSAQIQCCLLIILFISGVSLLLVLLRTSFGVSFEAEMLPGLVFAAASFRVSWFAALVSDKCLHVPSLVNSVQAKTILCSDRLYAAQYISISQAGFYIGEMRITCGSVVKASYIAGAVAIGVASRLDSAV